MTKESTKPPVWFWIVSVLALLWNLMGVNAYFQQAYRFEGLTEAQLEFITNRPAWATAAFAIAVFSGALGCLVLLLRKSLAYWLLLLSFVGVVVQMIHAVLIDYSPDAFGPGGLVMTIMILVVSYLLIRLAKTAQKRAWIS